MKFIKQLLNYGKAAVKKLVNTAKYIASKIKRFIKSLPVYIATAAVLHGIFNIGCSSSQKAKNLKATFRAIKGVC